MSDLLIEQLNKLKDIKPSQEWKKRTGDFLMSEIKNDRYYEEAAVKGNWLAGLVDSTRFVKLAWKPVRIFALIALFFLSSSGLVVVAAQNAMPGDGLFAFKRVIEKSRGTMTADVSRRVELAGVFLGNRVDELQKALVQESQLVASEGSKGEFKTVVLAVAEVRKQLNDVDEKLNELKIKQNGGSKNAVVAALVLDEKIRHYKQQLEQAKDKVGDKEVGIELNEALEQVEEINGSVLELIVDRHEKGQLELAVNDLENKLEEHVALIEERVVEVEEVIAAKIEVNGAEVKSKASEAREKIDEAKEAILKYEYGMVLTLAKDSNEILKMLYGEISEVIENTDEILVAPNNGEVEGVSSTASSVNSVNPVNTVNPVNSVEEGEEAVAEEEVVEEIQEFDVGI